MKRMIAWLETLLSRWGAGALGRWGAGAEKPSNSTGDAANDTHYQPAETNAPMPDIYTDKHVPDRKFLDPSSQDADKTTGFNPYDTAKLHKK